MADWDQPTNGSPYGDVIGLLKDLSLDAAQMFLSAPTNPVDGMIKLNRSPVTLQERGTGIWTDLALPLNGGGTGATTAGGARSNLGLGSMALQDSAAVSITGGTIGGDGSALTGLNASNLGSGTVPDARFPSTLPAVNGSSLTALNASNLGSGTIPNARFPSTLPALNGSNLTALNASNLTSGTVPDARFPSTLPALNASNLTALNASNLAAGTVPQARKWSETTITSTGNQDNVSFSGADLLRCNNSSLLTLRGLLAGTPGQLLTIVSVGAGQVDLANQDTNSTNVNRIVNGVTAEISLAAGRGRAVLECDGTTQRWRVIQHEQGA